jgi:hypothetical protein
MKHPGIVDLEDILDPMPGESFSFPIISSSYVQSA